LGLLLLLAYIGLDESGLAARTVLTSTLLATTSLLIAGDLLSNKGREYTADRFTGVLFTLLGITFFLRAVSLDMLPVSGNMLTAGMHTSLTYLLAPGFAILVAFGYILMQTERLQSHLRRQADTDYLTGLYSRRCLIQLAKAALKRAKFDNTPVSVIVMDLDRFKSINDRYGHQAGDSCLKSFAESLRVCLRPRDIIGRMGGEEFVAVLPTSTLDDATVAAERVRSYFEKLHTSHQEHRLSATVSIGVACSDQDGHDFENLFKLADAALYQAKRNGRNRVVQHSGITRLSATTAEL
jgi:diguanylate cyclase (GGDEF)-like protein